jgi:hypothetical protein
LTPEIIPSANFSSAATAFSNELKNEATDLDYLRTEFLARRFEFLGRDIQFFTHKA